jgi:hypothetical protein
MKSKKLLVPWPGGGGWLKPPICWLLFWLPWLPWFWEELSQPPLLFQFPCSTYAPFWSNLWNDGVRLQVSCELRYEHRSSSWKLCAVDLKSSLERWWHKMDKNCVQSSWTYPYSSFALKPVRLGVCCCCCCWLDWPCCWFWFWRIFCTLNFKVVTTYKTVTPAIIAPSTKVGFYPYPETCILARPGV